jgi:carbonic anhydrase/acetyltransferase-like protein (isoleucine patch superfamily)
VSEPKEGLPRQLTVTERKRLKTQIVLGTVSGGLFLGGSMFATAGVLATPWLFIPAGALGLASGVVFLVRTALSQMAKLDPGAQAPARIGLGAEVDASARIEAGAVVEMGATVEAGAVVKSGAVVRMGATIESNATVESGAVIGWGATVESGATVQRDASVGAGATVHRNAVLSAGGHLGTGGDLRASSTVEPPAVQAPRTERQSAEDSAADARERQIEALCDRLQAELQKGSPTLRSFLSATESSVASLRSACRDLLSCERRLRREVSPELMARLETERAALDQRIASAEDEQVRASLQRAAAAIDEQRSQRKRLARNADRLDAELTRMSWTIEGVIAQLVQVHHTGATGAEPELERGLERIRNELTAVTEALESVNDEERAALRRPAQVVPVTEEGEAESSASASSVRVRR